MNDYMLVSDTGKDGPIVTVLDTVNYAFDCIQHFDIKIFSKESYEYFRTPRRLNSYLLQITTGITIPLGVTMIVATQLADFHWLILDSSYNTVGVPGIAMPIKELKNKDLFK